MISSRVLILRHLLKQACIPVGCVPSVAVAVSWGGGVCLGVSAEEWGVCPGVGPRNGVSTQERCLSQGGLPHPPRGENDRRLWKHNLSATTVADGKNYLLLHLFKVRSCGRHQRFAESVDRVWRFVAVFVHRETVTMWRHWRRIFQRLDQNSGLRTNWGDNHFTETKGRSFSISKANADEAYR